MILKVFASNILTYLHKFVNMLICMNEEEQKVVIDTNQNKIFNKYIYSAVNEELEKYLKDNNIDEIHLCEFDTDACVQKTAIDLFENNIDVYILKDYCMSSAGVEVHNFAIKNLQRLIGKEYVI